MKPRTEISNESAKFVLNAYRPNGADAQDPVFRAALEQATRDPELAAWFKEQRSFDSLIVAKLAEFQPPATLYSAILAGIANRSPDLRFTIRPLLALAAVLVVSGGILFSLLMEGVSSSKMIEQYQTANLTMLNSAPAPDLDLVTANFSRTQQYLAEMKAPCIPILPEALHNLPTVGCKTLHWNGQKFSLTCFRLPSGELLHVFVIDNRVFHSINVEDQFKEMAGWHFKCERIAGMLVMFVSRASVAEIGKYI
ncbi:MAG: hypothetical protein JO066_09765 [Verrucomicrobia bacterium]|nr:hypothetical protein [Verrucomicrobiota bacterium]